MRPFRICAADSSSFKVVHSGSFVAPLDLDSPSPLINDLKDTPTTNDWHICPVSGLFLTKSCWVPCKKLKICVHVHKSYRLNLVAISQTAMRLCWTRTVWVSPPCALTCHRKIAIEFPFCRSGMLAIKWLEVTALIVIHARVSANG